MVIIIIIIFIIIYFLPAAGCRWRLPISALLRHGDPNTVVPWLISTVSAYSHNHFPQAAQSISARRLRLLNLQ